MENSVPRSMLDRMRSLLLLLLLAIVSSDGVDVADDQALAHALGAATPGTVIRIASGTYRGGVYRADLHGTTAAPIVICGADPAHPPELVGGVDGLHLSDCTYVELRDLILRGATGNV